MASRITNRVAVTDDHEDETPQEPVRKSRVTGGAVSKGWGAPKQERQEVVRAPYLDVKAGKLIVKILDDEPTVNFKNHYVASAKSYYTCSADPENGVRCPLCAAGHKNTQQFRMNVIDMDDPETVRTWTFGWTVAGILQGLAENKPLNDPNVYFHVWRTKPQGGGAYTYTILPMKARDLEEDHGIEPLHESVLEDFELYGPETVWIDNEKRLQDAAARLTDKDLGNNK